MTDAAAVRGKEDKHEGSVAERALGEGDKTTPSVRKEMRLLLLRGTSHAGIVGMPATMMVVQRRVSPRATLAVAASTC